MPLDVRVEWPTETGLVNLAVVANHNDRSYQLGHTRVAEGGKYERHQITTCRTAPAQVRILGSGQPRYRQIRGTTHYPGGPAARRSARTATHRPGRPCQSSLGLEPEIQRGTMARWQCSNTAISAGPARAAIATPIAALAQLPFSRAARHRTASSHRELPAERICGVLLWTGDGSPVRGCTTSVGVQVPPRTRFRIYSVAKPFPVAYTLHGHALSLRDIHIVTPRTPQAPTHFSTLTFTGPRPARELALKRALPTTR